MDPFFERLIVRAATIDELLSDDFDALPGQKGDANLAGRRLAAWCRSSASGDWSLFARRIERDRLSIDAVLAKFATVRRKTSVAVPAWIDDAIWIDATLQGPGKDRVIAPPEHAEPCAFEHLFAPVVEQAEALLWTGIDDRASRNLTVAARACLRHSLRKELCSLTAPALYGRFAQARKAGAAAAETSETRRDGGTSLYDRFIADMKGGGCRRLFEDKPVLLRLIALIARQWIDTSREFVIRLDSDLAAIQHNILHSGGGSRVAKIEGDLSDPHNGGHSVLIVTFEAGSRVVYKPKDLRLDAAWHGLVERLNRSGAPVELKAVRAIVREGYGWTEFIEHTGCADGESCKRFFVRAGAWLALFHCFAANDMHHENMIAASDHPVPIDLETILQATPVEQKSEQAEAQAFETATELVANSVMTVGLIPAYGKSPENKVFSIGGMRSGGTAWTKPSWNDVNSDRMRPARTRETSTSVPNLPHVAGRYAKFGDHVEDFVRGFEEYARFLVRVRDDRPADGMFDGFAALPVRKVVRPTRFYYMLLQRLKDHRSMDDGVTWSAQADFLARLSDWETGADPLWPLQSSERASLLQLNVPYFMTLSDGDAIGDARANAVRSGGASGLDRARSRLRALDEREIAWQVDVIRQNTAPVSRSDGSAPIAASDVRALRSSEMSAPSKEAFVAEAGKIAADLARYAIRKGPSAAWIGLDWLGDSEAVQLVPLGVDLYNGAGGIAVFLAAHAAVTRSEVSKELALAAVAHLRKNLNGRNAARMARSLGAGAAIGLGSVVYALTVMASSLADDGLLADAHVAAELFSDDLIAADKQLDVIEGCAGAILCLLRLYRDGRSAAVLARAQKCGEHLLAQPRTAKSWVGQGGGDRPLNGMSHGAAGFAYALASLAQAAGRGDFAAVAAECIAFENSSYDAQRTNWPDFRAAGSTPNFPCQWCHGAPGIGLARIGIGKCRGFGAGPLSGPDPDVVATDIRNALSGVERGWPGHVDTLCCGTLGSIEFFCEAADALGRSDLRELASRRMAEIIANAAATGDYLFNVGRRQFNLGLFRGLAGVGYSCLRQVDRSLPNVLIWE